MNTKKSTSKRASILVSFVLNEYSRVNCSQVYMLWTNIYPIFRARSNLFKNHNTRERLKRKFRNRYLLVAVRSPDHHGLFVDDLTGGDGVDLLDVLDLGNGLHDYVLMYVRL